MRTIIKASGVLTQSCSKSAVIHAFDLNKDAEMLCIDFSYTPKIMQDHNQAYEIMKKAAMEYLPEEELEEFLVGERNLCNLLTLSLDHDSGFRGCAHRHPSNQHIEISETCATPGFLAGQISAGRWKLTVSVHSIVTEVCEYMLHIYEGDKI